MIRKKEIRHIIKLLEDAAPDAAVNAVLSAKEIRCLRKKGYKVEKTLSPFGYVKITRG